MWDKLAAIPMTLVSAFKLCSCGMCENQLDCCLGMEVSIHMILGTKRYLPCLTRNLSYVKGTEKRRETYTYNASDQVHIMVGLENIVHFPGQFSVTTNPLQNLITIRHVDTALVRYAAVQIHPGQLLLGEISRFRNPVCPSRRVLVDRNSPVGVPFRSSRVRKVFRVEEFRVAGCHGRYTGGRCLSRN